MGFIILYYIAHIIYTYKSKSCLVATVRGVDQRHSIEDGRDMGSGLVLSCGPKTMVCQGIWAQASFPVVAGTCLVASPGALSQPGIAF